MKWLTFTLYTNDLGSSLWDLHLSIFSCLEIYHVLTDCFPRIHISRPLFRHLSRLLLSTLWRYLHHRVIFSTRLITVQISAPNSDLIWFVYCPYFCLYADHLVKSPVYCPCFCTTQSLSDVISCCMSMIQLHTAVIQLLIQHPVFWTHISDLVLKTQIVDTL